MNPKAVIFGAIGTIAETSELQRRAFNEAFAENAIAVRWRLDQYRALLRIPGGRQRIRLALGDAAPAELVERIHASKTTRFHELLAAGPDVVRPGFERFVTELLERDVRIAIASTTVRTSIELLLECLRDVRPSDFDAILSTDDVRKPKPHGEVYRVCLERLDVDATDALAIEDAASGVASANRAGLQALAIPGANTAGHNFSSALAVCRDYHELMTAGLNGLGDGLRRSA